MHTLNMYIPIKQHVLQFFSKYIFPLFYDIASKKGRKKTLKHSFNNSLGAQLINTIDGRNIQ